MKYSTTLLGAAALAIANVAAFPHAMFDMIERAEKSGSLAQIEAAIAAVKEKRQLVSPGFNAAAQYVSNQGANKFVPPNFAAGDQRGPCPGLNAMANHG